MRKIQRLALVGAMAALAAAVAGCGGAAPTANTPAPAAPSSVAPPSSPSNGVTTPADVFGPACGQLPQGGEPGSVVRAAKLPVVAAINATPLLKSLGIAVQKAALTDLLNQQKEITVFAPYDRGFANFQQGLGADRFNTLMADQNKLGDALKYHVVVKRYDRAGLVAAKNVTTLQGGNLQIRDAGDTMEITDNAGTTAHVLCGNIPTANATVFLIDNVLQPRRP